MAYDTQLKTDPAPLPLRAAVLILLHKKRKLAFVSFTTNARGRAGVLASAIRHRGKKDQRAHLRDLPEGTVKDFALLATNIDIDPAKADKTVKRVQAKLEKDGYKFFGSPRSAVPMVQVNGSRLSLVEAMKQSKTKTGYQTVYRRIQRGWPVKQALDLEDRK